MIIAVFTNEEFGIKAEVLEFADDIRVIFGDTDACEVIEVRIFATTAVEAAYAYARKVVGVRRVA